MPIYWTFAAIPELADLSPAERRRAWRRGATRALLRPLPLFLLFLGCLATAGVTIPLVERVRSPALALAGVLAFSLLWGFAFAQWLAERARPHLREIAARAAEPTRAEALRTDPANWRLGVVYVCREDPRVVVRNLAPIGWSWNFAHPAVLPAIALAIAVFLGPLYAAWGWGVRSPGTLAAVAGASLALAVLAAHRLARDPDRGA